MFIYSITNKVNDKKYVGKTINPKRRWQRHKSSAKRGSPTHIHKAMRKYGEENFVFEIIEESHDDRETFWINQLNAFVNGYNQTKGGDGGDTSKSEGYINGMKSRRSYKGENNPMYGIGGMLGKKHKEETKKKQAEARQKYWDSLSIEEKEKRGDKIAGENNGMFGKTPGNAVPIKYKGVVYKSLAEARKATGRSNKFLKKHCDDLS